jgi:hypothetical protein
LFFGKKKKAIIIIKSTGRFCQRISASVATRSSVRHLQMFANST